MTSYFEAPMCRSTCTRFRTSPEGLLYLLSRVHPKRFNARASECETTGKAHSASAADSLAIHVCIHKSVASSMHGQPLDVQPSDNGSHFTAVAVPLRQKLAFYGRKAASAAGHANEDRSPAVYVHVHTRTQFQNQPKQRGGALPRTRRPKH